MIGDVERLVCVSGKAIWMEYCVNGRDIEGILCVNGRQYGWNIV